MRIIASAMATVALAAGMTAPTTGPQWTACHTNIKCAYLTVPVDWNRPDGPTTQIELGLLPAKDPAHKRGSLVVATGGPTTTAAVMDAFPQGFDDLRQWYDIVGMDPRGMGWDNHVACGRATEVGSGEDPSRAGWLAYRRQNAAFDATCHQAGAALVNHLSTWQVAHDLDAVRAALGEDKLTYFGNSYGTVYAQAYAELFPGRINRMFLDSVLDHSYGDLYRLVAPDARVTEQNFHLFADWCGKNAQCALHGQDVVKAWDDLVAKAEKTPLPAGPGKTVTATNVRLRSALYVTGTPSATSLWVELGKDIDQAVKGNAAAFLPDHSQPPDGTSVHKQMVCADYPVNTDYDYVTSAENRIRREAPRVGWTQVKSNFGMCSGLRRTETWRPHPLRVRDVPPILLSAGTRDNATPISMGQHVSAQLPGSRFVPSDSGHAGYLRGDPCLRAYVHAYLLDGTLPPPGATCLTP
ncbi:alpha/beta fold hydrolase [Fodinicola acaciae]|uniref:alpha/beta fold hydrolase n=1 Tax=Fodinicola acaciae TaxID=2681555 RepID=UPI0013CF7EB2|nr:alpha/beta fold hydrolase [Fodinicola acaciae]